MLWTQPKAILNNETVFVLRIKYLEVNLNEFGWLIFL